MGFENISKTWSDPLPSYHLQIFVTLPGGLDGPTLVNAFGVCFMRFFASSSAYLMNALPEDDRSIDSGLVREYEDIFIRVKQWGAFEDSDIVRNDLCEDGSQQKPDFVAELERKLDSEPGLAPDVCCFSLFSLATLLMLTGLCRRMTVLNLSATLIFGTHILGLSREGPSTAGH